MKNTHLIWITGLLATLAIILVPLALFWPQTVTAKDDPWTGVPKHPIHTSHADLIKGPFTTGPEVTRACLECHPDSATQVMATTHWTWESKPFDVAWRDEPVTIGKANQLNNFCISAQGNQKKCTSCHTGYGWTEGEYDFTKAENVDCLACHATAGYAKGEYGNPAPDVALVAAAQSVAAPTRVQCGKCHFNGGGGNNVKHGDLDESLYYPKEELDVHMGGADLICTDCHRTEAHAVKGRLIVDNVTVDPAEQAACTDCHAETLHSDERLNAHTPTVACQTCHVPAMALKDPTKVSWDWSTAGLKLQEDDHFNYLNIKGSFEYEKEFKPTYLWFNGNLSYRYLLGDKIDPSQPTMINQPAGDIADPGAKIFPFKLHVSKQPYDTVNNYLLAPITAGPDGFWTDFDWDNAFELAEATTGLEYSGSYGFAETWMYWPTTHMVQPKENALQCNDCHGAEGRLDWAALGYPGDPMEWGGRSDNNK